jgi:hypothetical protein
MQVALHRGRGSSCRSLLVAESALSDRMDSGDDGQSPRLRMISVLCRACAATTHMRTFRMNTANPIAVIGMLLLLSAGEGAPGTTPEASASAAVAPTSAAPAEGEDAVMADIESILGHADGYKTAFLALQKAVAAGDKEAVAQMVLYPLEQAIDGTQTIQDAGQFIREYDRIVTPAISDAITRQKFADVMVNKNGIMLGNGQAWLTGICEDDACQKQSILVSALQDTGDLDHQAGKPAGPMESRVTETPDIDGR